MKSRVEAESSPNIAFVKYWGKRNCDLNLPEADSIAVVLSGPRVRTRVGLVKGNHSTVRLYFNDDRKEIIVSDRSHRAKDGDMLAPKLCFESTNVVTSQANAWRKLAEFRLRKLKAVLEQLVGERFSFDATITSPVPFAAGLASSSAVYSGLTVALCRALGLELGKTQLSVIARLGSGSASRSVPDGFVLWRKGRKRDGSDSYAESIAPPQHWPELTVLLAIIDRQPKKVGSTEGMLRCQKTSPRYKKWVKHCQKIVPKMLEALYGRDFYAMAELSEENCKQMHELCRTAAPPIEYWTKATKAIATAVVTLRKAGYPVFFTVDAGPNPILFTTQDTAENVIRKIQPYCLQIITCCPGLGAKIVE